MTGRLAIYPGSFDPLTNGHLDIVFRGLTVFDRLVIAVAENARKSGLFEPAERVRMIREVLADEPRIEVDAFDGLTIEYAMRRGATAIIRGLRAVADFEYELQMANMNRKLSSNLETLFIMTSEKFFFVSSQNVKEVARFGGNVDDLVPPLISAELRKKMSEAGNR